MTLAKFILPLLFPGTGYAGTTFDVHDLPIYWFGIFSALSFHVGMIYAGKLTDRINLALTAA